MKRYWTKVEITPGGCWEWIANKDKDGYGKINVGGKQVRAHRLAYEMVFGPIPDGLQMDHLCRNPSCVKPAHLEAVTQKENGLRGFSLPARNARKTHCKHGHPLSGYNLLTDHRGNRGCRQCNLDSVRRYIARKKAVAEASIAEGVR